MFRGTLRHTGWPETMHAVNELGLLDLEPVDRSRGTTCREVSTRRLPPGSGSVISRAAFPDGRHDDIRSTLNLGGEPWGDRAMWRTVALPASIAARRLLDGELQLSGVHTPVEPEIYRPVLEELEEVGNTIHDR